VSLVTEDRVVWENNHDRENIMPILMIALLALACFGAIGILLVMAGVLERKRHNPSSPSSEGAVPGGKPTA
jgi:hypothetical protein